MSFLKSQNHYLRKHQSLQKLFTTIIPLATGIAATSLSIGLVGLAAREGAELAVVEEENIAVEEDRGNGRGRGDRRGRGVINIPLRISNLRRMIRNDLQRHDTDVYRRLERYRSIPGFNPSDYPAYSDIQTQERTSINRIKNNITRLRRFQTRLSYEERLELRRFQYDHRTLRIQRLKGQVSDLLLPSSTTVSSA